MGRWKSDEAARDTTIDAIDVATASVSPKTTWIFLRVRLRDGTTGYGEATRFGAEEGIRAEIALARSLLAGGGHAIPGEALAALRMAHASEARNAVSNAMEQALLDALARRADLPLAQFLGGPHRRRLAAYANINRGTLDRTPAGFAAQARRIVAGHGYSAVKIAPFDGLNARYASGLDGAGLLAAGVERILAVRDAIGRDVRLLVDCHWRLSPLMALEVLRATKDAGLFWLEDALDEAAFDDADLRRLRAAANAIGVRTAGGEKLSTIAGMRDLLARGGCDAVLPDLRVAGIRQGMAMLELAAACGAECSLHNPVGPVLDAISVQAAAALPSFLILEGQVGESTMFDEIAGGRQALEQGQRAVPLAPGCGIAPKLPFGDSPSAISSRPATFAGLAGAGPDG